MSTFKLKFQSPKFLNENQDTKSLESPQWTHIDGSELEINVEDWIVHKVDKKGSCKLSDCEADETNCKMKFQGEESKGNFHKIDYPFAISMLGQVVPKEDLIHYLKQLEGQFKMGTSEIPAEKEVTPHEDNEESKDNKDSDKKEVSRTSKEKDKKI